MDLPLTKPIKAGSVPFGYVVAEDKSCYKAIPEHIEALKDTVEGVISGKVASYREAKEIIESICKGSTISHQTISNYVRQEKIDLGIAKPRRPYEYRESVKKKKAAQRSLRTKLKQEEKLEKKLAVVKNTIRRQTKLQSKLDEPVDLKTTEGKVIDLAEVEKLPESVQEEFSDKEGITVHEKGSENPSNFDKV